MIMDNTTNDTTNNELLWRVRDLHQRASRIETRLVKLAEALGVSVTAVTKETE